MIRSSFIFWSIRAMFSEKCFAMECGHFTKRIGMLSSFGKSTFIALPMKERGMVDLCLGCIERMTVQCPKCNEPVFIGDAVAIRKTLVGTDCEDALSVSSTDSFEMISCLKGYCADNNRETTGRWLPGKHGKSNGVLVPNENEK